MIKVNKKERRIRRKKIRKEKEEREEKEIKNKRMKRGERMKGRIREKMNKDEEEKEYHCDKKQYEGIMKRRGNWKIKGRIRRNERK